MDCVDGRQAHAAPVGAFRYRVMPFTDRRIYHLTVVHLRPRYDMCLHVRLSKHSRANRLSLRDRNMFRHRPRRQHSDYVARHPR